MFSPHDNYFTKLSSELEEWNKFPQNEIDKAIDQFRTRLRKAIDVGGKNIEQNFLYKFSYVLTRISSINK